MYHSPADETTFTKTNYFTNFTNIHSAKTFLINSYLEKQMTCR